MGTVEKILHEIDSLEDIITSAEEEIGKLIKKLPALYYVLSYSWAGNDYVFGSGCKFIRKTKKDVIACVMSVNSEFFIYKTKYSISDLTEVAAIYRDKDNTTLSGGKIGSLMRITPLYPDYNKVLKLYRNSKESK